MPAPVPPGFTRGPIIFFAPFVDDRSTDRLLQSFWDEIGSYGARVLIVSTDAAGEPALEHLRTWFAAAEVDSMAVLSVRSRTDALEAGLVAQVENATGILIVDTSPLRFTSIFGGTPVAQAIRRANARGRAVGGIGRAGAVLCQHMLTMEDAAPTPGPLLHRSLIQFAPGLGIVNRLAVSCADESGAVARTHLGRLLTAVAYNPFLIGVALDPDTGAAVYPDSTLEIFGVGNALVVDGWQITHTDLHLRNDNDPVSVMGVQVHVLSHGYTYHLDTHIPQRPPDTEIPKEGYEQFGSF